MKKPVSTLKSEGKSDAQELNNLFKRKIECVSDPFSYLSEVPLGGTPPSFRLEAKRLRKKMMEQILYLCHVGEDGYIGIIQQNEDKTYQSFSLTRDMNLLAGTIYLGQFNEHFYLTYLSEKVALVPDQNQLTTASPFSKSERDELEARLADYDVTLYCSLNKSKKTKA